jgi:hypothetical protein
MGKETISSHGYKVVTVNGKTKYVHRLLAEEHIPNPNNYPCVNHINGNKLDNRIENLEWTTRRNNCEHARLNGLSELKSQGVLNLTWEQYNKIFELREKGLSYRNIGSELNLEYRRVIDVHKGKRYKDFYEKRKEVNFV